MLAQLSFQGFIDWISSLGSGFLDYLSNPVVWVSLILIVGLLVVLYILSKRQPSRIKAFNNDNGYVEIARSALVEMIRTTSEQVDIEKKPGVFVRNVRGKLNVDVKIRLLPSRKLTEVTALLQKHIIEMLQEGMGIRKLGKINVVVVGVRVKPSKEVRKSLPLFKSDPEPKSETAPVEVVDQMPEKEPEETNEPGIEEPSEGKKPTNGNPVEKI